MVILEFKQCLCFTLTKRKYFFCYCFVCFIDQEFLAKDFRKMRRKANRNGRKWESLGNWMAYKQRWLFTSPQFKCYFLIFYSSLFWPQYASLLLLCDQCHYIFIQTHRMYHTKSQQRVIAKSTEFGWLWFANVGSPKVWTVGDYDLYNVGAMCQIYHSGGGCW